MLLRRRPARHVALLVAAGWWLVLAVGCCCLLLLLAASCRTRYIYTERQKTFLFESPESTMLSTLRFPFTAF
jgi:hypothetical protein